MADNALLMLGLARRAGKLIFGSENVVLSARQGKIKLALLATDASGRTKKLMQNKCKSFSVPLYELSTKEARQSARKKRYFGARRKRQ